MSDRKRWVKVNWEGLLPISGIVLVIEDDPTQRLSVVGRCNVANPSFTSAKLLDTVKKLKLAGQSRICSYAPSCYNQHDHT